MTVYYKRVSSSPDQYSARYKIFLLTEDNNVKKHALLISCCAGKEKQHNTELRNLEGVLDELGWEGKLMSLFRFTCQVAWA